MQDTQPIDPVAVEPHPTRTKRRWLWPVVALTSVLLLAAIGAGVWFGFLSPQSSEASLSVATDTVATAEQVALTGSVSPAQAGRGVELQHRAPGEDTWRTVSSAVTTSDGGFTLEVDSGQEPGAMQYRVVALEQDRYPAVHSAVVDVRVLAPTILAAKPPRRMRTDRPAVIPGTVSPASVRDVIAEVSTDGQGTWTQLGTATSTPDGKFRIRFTHDERLSGMVRVRTDDTDEHAGATTDPADLDVEDYQAAGKVYLNAVEDWNALVNPDVDFNNFAATRDYYVVSVDAATKMSQTLQRYKHWPHEVRPLVKSMIDQLRVQLDTYRNMAKADSLNELNSIYDNSPLPAMDQISDASKIRSILGLPERPVA